LTETVFISGAARGLGLALTNRFLEADFHVFAGARSQTGLAALSKAYPGRLDFVALDVTDMASIRACAQQVGAQIPSLDMLVNNAAVNLERGRSSLAELDLADGHLEQTMSVNVFGPLRLIQQFQPLLARGGRKLILNISSEAGSITDCGRDREFAYCMSKAALNMQTKLLHNALSPQGLRVLSIHPGWIRTDMGGPQAHLSPEESAEAVFRVAQESHPHDAIYLDFHGQPLNW
jgi:NAD(P)-dependent dehydrogenase (short-subunit alcohol dehydrogenase family)